MSIDQNSAAGGDFRPSIRWSRHGVSSRLAKRHLFASGRIAGELLDLSAENGSLHQFGILMGLITLHVSGALYHTLVLRDGLIRRMSFGWRWITARAARLSH
jgi:hypothetical protein